VRLAAALQPCDFFTNKGELAVLHNGTQRTCVRTTKHRANAQGLA